MFRKKQKSVKFDIKTLRENDISVLTLDERWNKLFNHVSMTPDIKREMKKVNDLVKKQAGLYQEEKSLEPGKKKLLGEIMKLTSQAFEENDDTAKKQLNQYKSDVDKLNLRIQSIENDLYDAEKDLREANFNLLEATVICVYQEIKDNKVQKEQIEKEFEAVKKQLKELQKKRDELKTDWTEVYAFFHDLLGADEMTRLDLTFLGEEVVKHETDNTGTDADGRQQSDT